MAYYVIMDANTEQLYHKPNRYSSAVYDTERGAKIACTKLNNQTGNSTQWIVLPYEEFELNHNPLVQVINALTGKPTLIRKSELGTCSDPSTNKYHSM